MNLVMGDAERSVVPVSRARVAQLKEHFGVT
jgi:LytTR family transcriptional regulator, CO-responsive transcriptional regulator RcoM